jgi:alpha-N-arabinofuranosidase
MSRCKNIAIILKGVGIMKNISMLINAKDKIAFIHPEIYGHFSEHLGRCIYNGIYVGEDSVIPNVNGIRTDVVDAFRNIKLPVLRWPGGCFAEEYHWKDAIGEKKERKKMVNTNWGGVTEDNSFGTHEFMELCEQVGCEPYIAGNMGSGTVQELAEWVEYMTLDGLSPLAQLRKANGREKPWKLKYLGIGNENWGCGGNMRPEYYADEYRRYQSFCKNYSGNELFKIACGPSSADYNWMEQMMKNLDTNMTKGIALHYYTMPIWPAMESATEFDDLTYYQTISCATFLDTLLTRHTEIMNRYDPENHIGLVVDEWGCWHEVEPGTNPGFLYQQNTMRDAIVAAISLNIFNRHSKRVVMANLAQVVNVLQSLILTDGEKMIKTPTYHVFDLYKDHQGGEAVYCYTDNINMSDGKNAPMISSSASIKSGVMTITLANCSPYEEAEVSCAISHFAGDNAYARILTHEIHAHNDFDYPDRVKIVDYSVDFSQNVLTIKLPPCSVVSVNIE